MSPAPTVVDPILHLGTDRAGNPEFLLVVTLPAGAVVRNVPLSEPLPVVVHIEPRGLFRLAERAANNRTRRARLRWIEARATRTR